MYGLSIEFCFVRLGQVSAWSGVGLVRWSGDSDDRMI